MFDQYISFTHLVCQFNSQLWSFGTKIWAQCHTYSKMNLSFILLFTCGCLVLLGCSVICNRFWPMFCSNLQSVQSLQSVQILCQFDWVNLFPVLYSFEENHFSPNNDEEKALRERIYPRTISIYIYSLWRRANSFFLPIRRRNIFWRQKSRKEAIFHLFTPSLSFFLGNFFILCFAYLKS